MSSKYIVRQPIKDPDGKILGHEILYHGENQAFTVENPQAKEFASADTIYSFLTQNSTTTLKGSLNFMTFTTTLLMKKTPPAFRQVGAGDSNQRQRYYPPAVHALCEPVRQGGL